LDHPQRFHKPQRQLFRTIDLHIEGLRRIDEFLVVKWRGQQLCTDLGCPERQTNLS
jgi:hypothetical protein